MSIQLRQNAETLIRNACAGPLEYGTDRLDRPTPADISKRLIAFYGFRRERDAAREVGSRCNRAHLPAAT